MSTVQDIARQLLPDRVYNAIHDESQRWLMRCPCGHETSVWEMGGLRWKADGKAIRWGRCGACGERYVGQIYKQHMTAAASAPTSRNSETMNPPAQHREIPLDRPGTLVRLWIDGVGCWLLCPAQRLTLGGPVEPGSSQPSADLCLMANLRRQHAVIERVGDAYRFETTDGAINGRGLRGESFLKDGVIISLGQTVRMRFRQPSVLSASATLSPDSHSWPRMFAARQTPGSIDGIVLMDEVCLLGPGSDAHISCPDWTDTVIVYRRDGGLSCRTSAKAHVDGCEIGDTAPLGDGGIVTGDGWRFRAEAVGI